MGQSDKGRRRSGCAVPYGVRPGNLFAGIVQSGRNQKEMGWETLCDGGNVALCMIAFGPAEKTAMISIDSGVWHQG